MTVNVRNTSTEFSFEKKSKGKRSERKQQIAAILLMVAGFLIFLSLISYAPADQANGEIRFTELWKVFSNDPEIRMRAEHTHNWLGLVGAILSNALINFTFGYTILVFPILLFTWGWTLLRQGNFLKLTIFTTYMLILSLLISSSFGMVRLIAHPPWLGVEWSGSVGEFLSTVLSRLFGSLGASIVLLTLLFITAVLASDLDIKKSLDRLKDFCLRVVDWMMRKREEHRLHQFNKVKTEGLQSDETKQDIVSVNIVQEVEEKSFPPTVSMEQQEEHELSESLPMDARSVEEPLTIEETIQKEEMIVEERKTSEEEIDYVSPSVELLDLPRQTDTVADEELKANAELLRAKLLDFGVEIETVSVTPGPVVTLYELVPASGVKISSIVSLADDLALALAAKGIRIIAPIPGKSAVGVEIPNHNPSIVPIRNIINSSKFRDSRAFLLIAMGKTISGEVYTDDLSKMPHLLMAGATGSGKSVGINTILISLIYKLHPSDVKFVIIDPKKIELSLFASLKNHFLAVSPDLDEEIITTPQNAVMVLKSVEYEMEQRYGRLASAGVRNIADYNEKIKTGTLRDTNGIRHSKMPYLIVIIDELADLMLTAAREVEEPIARLAQLARAVGIHLVLATQRPSVDVITGVIKANFSARIAYQVASKIDSRTILDMNGAEQLLGNGDMLYLPSGRPKPVRIQNAFVSTEEVERVMNHIVRQKGYSKPFELPSIIERKRSESGGTSGERDELFEEAAHLVVRHQQGSVSLLQRRLKVGYSRAARLIDELEAAGIVGLFDGSKAREVLVENEIELEQILNNLERR